MTELTANESIMAGARELLDFVEGRIEAAAVHIPDQVNTKKMRDNLDMTQEKFAKTFGFSLSAVRHWEAGRRSPENAAKVLLRTIAYSPETVIRANQQV